MAVVNTYINKSTTSLSLSNKMSIEQYRGNWFEKPLLNNEKGETLVMMDTLTRKVLFWKKFADKKKIDLTEDNEQNNKIANCLRFMFVFCKFADYRQIIIAEEILDIDSKTVLEYLIKLVDEFMKVLYEKFMFKIVDESKVLDASKEPKPESKSSDNKSNSSYDEDFDDSDLDNVIINGGKS